LKITDIRTICMRVPYAPDKRVKSALGVWNHRNGMFLLVDTDQGLTGIGEIWSNFPQWSHYEKEATVHQGLKPLVLGRDPLDLADIWAGPAQTLKRIGLQWGAPGIVSQVLSGLDIALWDLRGKVEGKPICALLGYEPEPVQVYCSGLGPQNVVANARRMLEQGVSAFKVKIGMNRELDLQNLAELRQLIGPDRLLMADVNQGWDLETAMEIMPLLEPFRLNWLEEPLMADDVECLKTLQDCTQLPISGGENLYGGEFLTHLSQGLLDVCQPDITKCGGITGLLQVAQIAARYGVEVAPHFYGNGVGYAATLQVMAASGAHLLECDHDANPMKDSCVTGLSPVLNGRVAVPQGPGLGIELDEEAIAPYRFFPYPL
jgi:L-alanine-DL-glutamate epimerase-like enolase superfamily enzyme